MKSLLKIIIPKSKLPKVRKPTQKKANIAFKSKKDYTRKRKHRGKDYTQEH
jgi:hypothetical protein